MDAVLKLLARSGDAVFAVGGDQRIVFWGDTAGQLLGLPRSEVLGKQCYETIVGKDYEGHPFCRRDCPTIRAARRGRGVANYDIASNHNGSENWFNVSIVPVPRSIGGEAMAIHLLRDVTDRRRSERLAQAAVDTLREFMTETSESKLESKPYPAPSPSLTARELQVLRLLADGLSTQDLAVELGLSEATVRNHIQRLLAKLGVHSRLGAVTYGTRHGLI